MKKNNKKGFTLAELLIVVAIIAVLVAVAIPVFTAQLEKSRDATTAANLRSAYAEATAAWLSKDDTATNVTLDETNKTVAISGVQLLDTDKDLGDAAQDLPFDPSSYLPGARKDGGYSVTFTFDDAAGTVSCTNIA